MILDLAPCSTVDLGRIDTEETVVVRGVDNLTITNVEVVATTAGFGTRAYDGKQRHWPRHRHHLRFEDCDNLTIEKASVIGPHVGGGVGDRAYVEPLEAQHAFDFHGCSNVKLYNAYARQVYGDFVYLGGGCDGVDIRWFDFAKNGRQGIAASSARNVRIRDGVMDEIRRSAFDFEPHKPALKVTDVRAERVKVGAHRLTFIASKGRGEVSRVYFDDCSTGEQLIVIVESVDGIRRRSWSVKNCRAAKRHGSPQGAVMRFLDVDWVTVTGNYQPLQKGRNMTLANTRGSRWVKVRDNDTPER